MQMIPEEYVVLFNVITEAEEALHTLQEKLIKAQQLAEDIYINREETESDAPAAGNSDQG